VSAYLPLLGVFLAAFVTGTLYGVLLYKFEAFPYRYAKRAYDLIKPRAAPSDHHVPDDGYGRWSIGIYAGPSPLHLTDPAHISNPVLTAIDVTDLDAKYVADPFLVPESGRFYMFFEVVNRANDRGAIGYAESADAKTWQYKKLIINEPFHLSYPHVFKWGDTFYLIPESHEDLSIRLYRATSFPAAWQFVTRLFNGEHYVDPSIFRYDDTWWLFHTTPFNDALALYYSDDLMGQWAPHPMNPIVRLNKHIARPGGRVVLHRGRLYRFAQDCEPRYGIQLFAFEIAELSRTAYRETIVSNKPLLTMTGEGWNARGMHHVDAHLLDGTWMAAVDGQR
jgi:hypothetical protein